MTSQTDIIKANLGIRCNRKKRLIDWLNTAMSLTDRQWLKEHFWSSSDANISICHHPISHSFCLDSSRCCSSVTKDNFLDHVNNANCYVLNLCVELSELFPKNVSASWDFTVGQNVTSAESCKNNTLVAWALGKLCSIIQTFKTSFACWPIKLQELNL